VSAHRLETKRVVLLPWDSEDWLAFKPIATDPQVMRYVSEDGQPWTDAQIVEFVERQRNHYLNHGFCLWKMVSRDSEEVVGFCGLQPLTGTSEIEIGWWLSPGLWGQGIATEAAAAALADAFGRSGLDRAVAVAQKENRASTRVMEKIGMRCERETTHRGFRVVLYSIENKTS
jgi:ribosomal-protein-alanine N-acetyltransferase